MSIKAVYQIQRGCHSNHASIAFSASCMFLWCKLEHWDHQLYGCLDGCACIFFLHIPIIIPEHTSQSILAQSAWVMARKTDGRDWWNAPLIQKMAQTRAKMARTPVTYKYASPLIPSPQSPNICCCHQFSHKSQPINHPWHHPKLKRSPLERHPPREQPRRPSPLLVPVVAPVMRHTRHTFSRSSVNATPRSTSPRRP